MDHRAIVKLGRTGLNVTALGFGATAIGGMYEEVSGSQASEPWTPPGTRESGCSTRRRSTAWVWARCGSGRAWPGSPATSTCCPPRSGGCCAPTPRPTRTTSVPTACRSTRAPPPCATVYDYSRDGVLASIEESLARLGKDRLDIVYVHDPDDYVARGAGHRVPGSDRTPRAGRDQRRRSGHEPDRGAGDVRPGNRPGRVPAGRPVHPARAGRARTRSCRCASSAASR